MPPPRRRLSRPLSPGPAQCAWRASHHHQRAPPHTPMASSAPSAVCARRAVVELGGLPLAAWLPKLDAPSALPGLLDGLLARAAAGGGAGCAREFWRLWGGGGQGVAAGRPQPAWPVVRGMRGRARVLQCGQGRGRGGGERERGSRHGPPHRPRRLTPPFPPFPRSPRHGRHGRRRRRAQPVPGPCAGAWSAERRTGEGGEGERAASRDPPFFPPPSPFPPPFRYWSTHSKPWPRTRACTCRTTTVRERERERERGTEGRPLRRYVSTPLPPPISRRPRRRRRARARPVPVGPAPPARVPAPRDDGRVAARAGRDAPPGGARRAGRPGRGAAVAPAGGGARRGGDGAQR